MIDVDKFVASLIKHYYEDYDIDRTSIKCWLDDVLEDQGLEYKNGEIVKTQRRIAAEAKEALYNEPVTKTSNKVWSEEDQCKVNWLLHLITSNSDIDDSNTTECEQWLKSLKDRLKGGK